MFVVAGINGNTGAATADALLRAGLKVRGIARKPASAKSWSDRGVEIAGSTFDDAATLSRAFEGAKAAYLLAPPDLQHPDPVALYSSVAQIYREAARNTGLRRIVFLSSFGAQHPAGTGPIRGLHQAEAILTDAAPEVVFLRPASFMENWRGMMAPAQEAGMLPTFLSDLDKPWPTVSTADIGAAAAALLTDAAPARVVELRGPADYSVHDVAKAMSSAFGRTVSPVQPPRDAWEGILQQAGFGPSYASLLAEMYDGLNTGLVDAEQVPDQRRGSHTLDATVATWARN